MTAIRHAEWRRSGPSAFTYRKQHAANLQQRTMGHERHLGLDKRPERLYELWPL